LGSTVVASSVAETSELSFEEDFMNRFIVIGMFLSMFVQPFALLFKRKKNKEM
jgi:hypothetical protein